MKFENINTYNWINAIMGMRNPKNSWYKSDTETIWLTNEEIPEQNEKNGYIITTNGDLNLAVCLKIGDNDLKLMKSLISAGPEHRKFLRQIMVSVEVTAPLYWWKEMDTYKIGIVSDSCSTMHTIHTHSLEDLSCYEMNSLPSLPSSVKEYNDDHFKDHLKNLERIRIVYLKKLQEAKETTDPYLRTMLEKEAKGYWKEIIKWLPCNWLQKRSLTMNYENLYSIIHQRKNHKLNEWSGLDDNNTPNFMEDFILKLPYAKELLLR